MRKYPRTQHLEGSGLQKGDDSDRLPFSSLHGKFLVVEEKLDGANTGISFDEYGTLQLQCRGHYLTGGPGEAQFALLKPWAQTHQAWLWERLGRRYTLYGEWLYACHTVFYDRLPHYFFEFDILDTETETFLSTEQRRVLLKDGPVISVPVLREGIFTTLSSLTRLVGPSLYRTDGGLSEGLYIKVEENGIVTERYKWVRSGFIQTILDSGTHWKDRPIRPNLLQEGVDLW